MDNRRGAIRYPISAPLLFREPGASRWHRGTTLNLSRSGVLFRADCPTLTSGRALDFVVTLPLNGVHLPPQVRCTGRVVRVTAGEAFGAAQGVAVAIDGYAIESWRRA